MTRDAEQTPASSPPPGERPGLVDALTPLSFLVLGTLGQIAAEHDLSITQTRLLGILRDRSAGMQELARHLELDKSSVTGLIDRAERRGLVRRKASATDGRAFEVSLTPAGRKIAQRGEADFEERITALAAFLTEAERSTLRELASRLVHDAAKSSRLNRTSE